MEINQITTKEEPTTSNPVQESAFSTEEKSINTNTNSTVNLMSKEREGDKLSVPSVENSKAAFYCDEKFPSGLSRSNSLTSNGIEMNAPLKAESSSMPINQPTMDYGLYGMSFSSLQGYPLLHPTSTDIPNQSVHNLKDSTGGLTETLNTKNLNQYLSPPIFSESFIQSLMKSILPSYAIVDPDCYVVMQTMVNEFLNYLLAQMELITDEADFSNLVLKALCSLGMTELAATLEPFCTKLSKAKEEGSLNTNYTKGTKGNEFKHLYSNSLSSSTNQMKSVESPRGIDKISLNAQRKDQNNFDDARMLLNAVKKISQQPPEGSRTTSNHNRTVTFKPPKGVEPSKTHNEDNRNIQNQEDLNKKSPRDHTSVVSVSKDQNKEIGQSKSDSHSNHSLQLHFSLVDHETKHIKKEKEVEKPNTPKESMNEVEKDPILKHPFPLFNKEGLKSSNSTVSFSTTTTPNLSVQSSSQILNTNNKKIGLLSSGLISIPNAFSIDNNDKDQSPFAVSEDSHTLQSSPVKMESSIHTSTTKEDNKQDQEVIGTSSDVNQVKEPSQTALLESSTTPTTETQNVKNDLQSASIEPYNISDNTEQMSNTQKDSNKRSDTSLSTQSSKQTKIE